MKKVIIELWLGDEEEVNDISVGRALGEAIMLGDLTYISPRDDNRLGNYEGLDD